jgi:dihydropteroate synthase
MLMKTIRFSGRELDLRKPVVMGILNITPDSFYDGGKHESLDQQVAHAGRMIAEGASIIDVGAVSTRPGSTGIPEKEEIGRLLPVLDKLLETYPGSLFSVDTFRPGVVRAAADHGAFMINDIYGGTYDDSMAETIARLGIPYVIMHMKGTPADMQVDPVYGDVVAEVAYFLDCRARKLRESGVISIILDPGFGFGKTPVHNFQLLSRLGELVSLGYPILAGLSRKSMICRTLGVNPGDALNGTTVVNTLALLNGASILRVHDVREAAEAIRLVEAMKEAENS